MFKNPIAALSGVLTFPSIHSPNYVPGVSGWTINRDGTVEFNTLGGTLQVNNNGIFFYIPNAGTGNLRAAITTTDGTDQYGNSYHGGLFVNQKQVWATGDHSDSIVLNPAGGTAGPEIQFVPTGFNALYHFLMDQAGNRVLAEPVNASGASFEVNGDAQVNTALYAKDPNAVFRETWHSVILVNGWANKAGAQAAKYRKLASPPNSVEIVGDITGGTATNSTTLFQLPAGYRPPTVSPATPIYTANRNANNDPPVVFLDTSGNVKLFNCAGATELQINAIFALDS